MRLASLAWCASLVLAPALARAEGSGGAGGPSGETSDWPCDGCVTATPSGPGPWPLLVTFHGDEGEPDYIHGAFREVAPGAGFLLVSLRCPRELGCGGSWWRWEASGSHDDFAWVHAQLDAVEAAFDVERDQIYLAGFSGGSSYLSELVPRHTDRVAGAVYLGGGYRPYGVDCAPCRVPIHFVIGDRDFLLDGAMDLRAFYESCEHAVDWQLVAGVDHQIVEARLPGVLEAMRARRHPCRAPAPTPDAGLPDAGAAPGWDAGARPDAGALGPVDGGVAPDPSAPRELALVGDCAIGRGRGSPLGLALLYLLARRTRARAKRASAAGSCAKNKEGSTSSSSITTSRPVGSGTTSTRA